MRTRRIVAAVLLAMLPPVGVVSTAAFEPVAGQSADWAWAVGMDADEAALFALGGIVMCSLIPNPGAIACGVVGVF